jgi:hypothetical protein
VNISQTIPNLQATQVTSRKPNIENKSIRTIASPQTPTFNVKRSSTPPIRKPFSRSGSQTPIDRNRTVVVPAPPTFTSPQQVRLINPSDLLELKPTKSKSPQSSNKNIK